MADTLIDIAGHVFGRLTVIERAPNQGKRVMWVCRCDCGNTVIVRAQHLRQGLVQSCKCLRRERIIAAHVTHGAARKGQLTREFVAWCSMKSRCLYPGATSYAYYGGRGIKVCDRWLNSFENFLADMRLCPNGYSLDRINSDGNYEPANCRWADKREQSRNRRNVTNGSQEFHGKLLTRTEFASALGIHRATLHKLYRRGLTAQQIIARYGGAA